jgi:hypothetical protein
MAGVSDDLEEVLGLGGGLRGRGDVSLSKASILVPGVQELRQGRYYRRSECRLIFNKHPFRRPIFKSG